MSDRFDPGYNPSRQPGQAPRRQDQGRPAPRPQAYRSPRPMGPTGPEGRPVHSDPSHRQTPVPDAQAAQRAARSSLQSQASSDAYESYGDYGNYYGQEGDAYSPYEEADQDLPNSYAYLDDLMDDEEEGRPPLPLPAKIGLIAGVAIVGLLLLFVLIRAVFMRNDSDVRLQRQTLPKKGVMETTLKPTKPSSTELPTLPEHTLPPLGTDPYDNAPAWTPPVAPPPPVVDMPEATPELPPAYIEPQPVQPEVPEAPREAPQPEWTNDPQLPAVTPAPQPTPAGETSPPPLPTDANGQPVLPSGQETSPPPIAPTEPPTPLEDLPITLPDLALPGQYKPPYTEQGTSIAGESSRFFMRPDVNGQPSLANIPGNFIDIYNSPDNSYTVGLTADGQYRLFSSTQTDPVDLPFGSAQGLEKLVGNQGLAYLSSNQLYYLSYTDFQPRVIAANVTDALMAEDSGNFLVVSEAGVKLLDYAGNLVSQLMEPYTSQGNIKLDSLTSDGKLAVYQDDFSVYIYRPDVLGGDPARLTKAIPGNPSYTRVSLDGQEVLSYQLNGQAIARMKSDGSVDQVTNPNWSLSEQSIILPVGSTDGSNYGSLAVWDQGNLYLANAYASGDGSGVSQASLVFQGVKEVFAAGYGLYWTDQQGTFYGIDARANLGSSEAAAVQIANGVVSHISSNEDGSAIYYLKNGSLWMRQSGSAAVKLADGVASYMSNPEGSKFYLVTQEGGLQVLAGGVLGELLPAGSGVDASSLDINPMASQGGNTWIATPRIAWLANGMVYEE
ncbi:MAG: hypothetical protein SPK23_02860 [Eubacteriales bacterium]|nr:hypothetical protein [Clostridiales bacterium]MDY5836050.1 hypothetical protein [Eubacteriales bacterium]